MRRRATGSVMVALVWLLSLALPAWAHSLTSSELAGVGFEPHPGAAVPRDLIFHDEYGQVVRLGNYIGQGPLVISLNMSLKM